jgi:molecular chaperone HscB
MKNYFEIFHLPQHFSLEIAVLDRAYYQVQSRTHPDRFSNSSSQQKQVAMRWATHANEAYQILKDPSKRAAYLCQLNGIDLQSNLGVVIPPGFLIQQMEWRENLESVTSRGDIQALKKLDSELHTSRNVILQRAETLLNSEDFPQAALCVRQLMFLEKLREKIDNTFVDLES